MTTQTAKHPKTCQQDRYEPACWEGEDGPRKYSLRKNGYGHWWPVMEVRHSVHASWYPTTIRNSNPFKTFSGGVRYVEKYVAKDIEQGKTFKGE
jgi:hypothetical protein